MNYRELVVEFIQEQMGYGNLLNDFSETWLRKYSIWLEDKAAKYGALGGEAS